MSDRPDVSVLVVSHGHEALLPACIGSLGDALDGVSAEILVVDNLGGGGVARALSGLAVSVVENARQRGFAANVNAAASATRGRHLLILNPDTEHGGGRVADAVRFLEARPEVGILGCTLRNADHTDQQSYRRFPSLAFLLVRGLGGDRWPWRPAFYRRRLMDDVRAPEPFPVDWVFGAFMMMRRADFERLGGMDEGFRLYYEDVDLCRRARLDGLSTWVFPELVLTHAHLRTSAKRPFSRTWRWHVASACRYFLKAAASRLPT